MCTLCVCGFAINCPLVQGLNPRLHPETAESYPNCLRTQRADEVVIENDPFVQIDWWISKHQWRRSPVSSVQVCGSNSHRHFACIQSEVGDIINPEGLKITLVSSRLGHPAAPPPSPPCTESRYRSTNSSNGRSQLCNKPKQWPSLCQRVSVSNKSKQKPAGLSGHVRRRQCPKCMCVCVFFFFLLWCVLCRKTTVLNLCARTQQSHPWTYSGAAFLSLSAVK